MQFTFTRIEEISREYRLMIEADNLDAAQEIYDTMRMTGEFYDEAVIMHEEVIDAQEYID